MAIERGEIYRVNLEPTIGSEHQGIARPCLIVSITTFNKARMIGVVTLSSPPSPSAIDRADPFGWESVSLALCGQLRAIDKRRLVGAPMGRLSHPRS